MAMKKWTDDTERLVYVFWDYVLKEAQLTLRTCAAGPRTTCSDIFAAARVHQVYTRDFLKIIGVEKRLFFEKMLRCADTRKNLAQVYA